MNKKKVLIVDDEIQLVELLKFRLESNGYEIVSAVNGKEGIEKIKSEKPDLVLMDIMMPEMDGYTAIRELREKEETKKIPIIIVSGKGDMIVQIKKRIKDLTLDGGSIEYILKPFEAVELLAKIDIAINTQ